MDGADLIRRLGQLLNEDSDSGWMDARSSYDFLYEAAIAVVDRTGCMKDSQSITTTTASEYNLNPDFLRLFACDGNERLFIKYGDDFLTWKDYEDILYADESTIPSHFTVTNADTPSQVTGTATSAGSSVGGLSVLTDSAADFSDVGPGAIVHNTTDGSSGVVLQASTTLSVALFGGTNNDWTIGDAYVIQPQGRYKIVLDGPTVAGRTITVNYVKRPDPVYHSYGVYPFPSNFSTALVKYALWLYKYRDREPNTGDALYQYWEREVRMVGNNVNRATRRPRAKVSFKRGR